MRIPLFVSASGILVVLALGFAWAFRRLGATYERQYVRDWTLSWLALAAYAFLAGLALLAVFTPVENGDGVVDADPGGAGERLRGLLRGVMAEEGGAFERERQLRWVAPGGSGGLLRDLEELGNVWQGTNPGVPGVGVAAHAPELARAFAADPDRDAAVHGLRVAGPAVAIEELAVKVDVLVAPEGLHEFDGLIHAAATAFEGHAEDFELLLPPACSEAGNEPPAGKAIERGEHLGMEHRLAHGQDQNARADGYARSDRGSEGQQHHGLEQVGGVRIADLAVVGARIGGSLFAGEDDVVEHPEAIEPRLLGGTGESLDSLGGGPGADLRDVETYLHREHLPASWMGDDSTGGAGIAPLGGRPLRWMAIAVGGKHGGRCHPRIAQGHPGGQELRPYRNTDARRFATGDARLGRPGRRPGGFQHV